MYPKVSQRHFVDMVSSIFLEHVDNLREPFEEVFPARRHIGWYFDVLWICPALQLLLSQGTHSRTIKLAELALELCDDSGGVLRLPLPACKGEQRGHGRCHGGGGAGSAGGSRTSFVSVAHVSPQSFPRFGSRVFRWNENT